MPVVKSTTPSFGSNSLAATLPGDAAELEVALNELIKPEAVYSKAIGERGALLPAWAKALGELKKPS